MGPQIGRLQALLHFGTVEGAAQAHVDGQAVVEHDHVLADHGQLLAQAAQLQMAALRAVQETPGQERALSTLSQAIVQTQDAFAVSAAKSISGIDILV
jgi:hypothetical protein